MGKAAGDIAFGSGTWSSFNRAAGVRHPSSSVLLRKKARWAAMTCFSSGSARAGVPLETRTYSFFPLMVACLNQWQAGDAAEPGRSQEVFDYVEVNAGDWGRGPLSQARDAAELTLGDRPADRRRKSPPSARRQRTL